MADPNSQRFVAATADASSTQHQAAVTAPQSHRGALGFFTVAAAAPKQGATMAAPSSPQGVPGFAVVPQGAENVAAPSSPQGPPGFWVAPEQVAAALPQGAPVMAPPQGQGATMMDPQQQHFAPAMVPSSQQLMQMLVQAASMGTMMTSMPPQAQAPAMVANQPAQGMAPSQSLPMCHPSMMEMQQAQAGHMTAPPPLPLGPPLMQQQQQQPSQADTVIMAQPHLPLGPPLMQQQQPSQADTVIMAQPPLPLGPPPAMLQQQPPQGATMMMTQPPLPLCSPSVMLQHNPHGNQVMMTKPQFAALPCKRQRLDQYDNTYGQHRTGHQEETTMINAAMGQSYGPNLHNGFSYFGAPQPSLPPDATSTIYVEGLPIDCTRREVAHIFRQYMGFLEMRLVNKGSNRHLCFVDFATPAHAFFAMRSLQGYKFDEQEPRSRILNLQFSHSPRMGSHGGS